MTRGLTFNEFKEKTGKSMNSFDFLKNVELLESQLLVMNPTAQRSCPRALLLLRSSK
ncbi:hypothetical protein NA56DRAFT_640081 [Hyaloscypha hepaticicola]|uniref:Uncharacterized protein n=1 Tax=Hyaloscypha hepaticicola TaxID=2082293 RepID=A0A2J6QQA3_9HELO|nr:hypothetical protein NA56DRAFT_640081 [Hyaloscypha hepaticicola]